MTLPPQGRLWPPPSGARILASPARNARSCAGTIHELFGDRLTPLRRQRLFRRNQIGAVRQVQAIAVGPVLVHAPPRIGPVVVDLTAEHVPADAPHVLVR